ncbi:MAG: hypothetical protein NC225_12470 [Clostridium sp.]|nr:hypothetical protein [Clostridium sp.]MCM1460473.1 hypothetical protein [Bacteroides sp.]
MKVEKSYLDHCYDGVRVDGTLHKAEQTAEQRQKSEEAIEQAATTAVSMKISKMGYTYAGQLPVDDSHEVYLARRQMRQGIDVSTRINGEFVGILAENYKSMADNIKENYTGEEFDRQMGILDKAYKEASEDLAHEYTRQMRILSGDIVIMPSTVPEYSTAAEAEAHRREFDAALDARKQVISEEKGEQMSNDVLKYLEVAKISVMDKGLFDWQNLKDVKTDVLNFMDLQKMGTFFVDKQNQTDVSGVSDFVREIISAYANR